MPQRIVVVGHSALTCLGRDMDTTWRGLIAGRSGLRRHAALAPESFLQDVAGMVEGFGPGTAGEDPAVAKLAARSLHLAMAAARQAWSDAAPRGLADLDPERVAVIVGSALGGIDLLDAEMARMAQRRSLAASPYLIPGLIINQAAGQIAQHLGFHGPSVSPANACASGGHAIALGAMYLRAGEADLALCGAGESAFTPPIVNGFATMKALLARKPEDRSADDPTQASRPFSIDRAGFVLSEGAGMLVLATESAAERFGLEIQGELAGWALNSDGHHMAMPHGGRIVRCLTTRAGARGAPARGDLLLQRAWHQHGGQRPGRDGGAEGSLRRTRHALPVSSIKGALGHSLGAASAIEAAVSVRALREQMVPPTINYRPDPELDLDFVPGEGRPAPLDSVLTASFGFGGTNNALILKRWIA